MSRLASLTYLMLSASVTSAGPVTYSTDQGRFNGGFDNQGWYSSGGHAGDDSGYVVGFLNSLEFRNFFTFDLSSTPVGTVTSAVLRISAYQTFLDSDAVYTLFDVHTPATQLNVPTADRSSAFADLGTGVIFGSVQIDGLSNSATTPGPTTEIRLNGDAVAAINAARGGYFSIGGALTDRQPGIEVAFNRSGNAGVQELVLDFATTQPASTVPEPSSIWLLLVGVGGVVGRRSISARTSCMMWGSVRDRRTS